MKMSEKSNVILPLLFKVKTELGSVTKSSNNPFFKSKYADLNTHLDVVEPVLEKYGLMLLQPVLEEFTSSGVESIIIHAESGQWVSSHMRLILAKNSMQDAGSAVTYARRYTLGALLSMKAEDDDGEAATGRSQTPYKTAPKVASIAPQNLSGTASPASAPNTLTTTATVAVSSLPKKSTFRKPTVKTEDAPVAGGNGWE